MYILTIASLESIEEHYFVEEFCSERPRLFPTAGAARAAVRKLIVKERKKAAESGSNDHKDEITRWKPSKVAAGSEFLDQTWGDPHDTGNGIRYRLFVVMP